MHSTQGPSPPKRIEYEAALDELGAGSRLMDYNRPLGELDELDELGECAQPSVSSRSEPVPPAVPPAVCTNILNNLPFLRRRVGEP
eukprot:scaffold26849_cov30-Phaeocystis_antarctica.AAC.1